jgi:hypothetical protein
MTENTMVKRKRTNELTMIYKTPHRIVIKNRTITGIFGRKITYIH